MDTSQDASYYGIWTNPVKLQTITYCEGDITIQTADTVAEYVEAIRLLAGWDGHRFKGIDPMMNPEMIARFTDIGLADLLH